MNKTVVWILVIFLILAIAFAIYYFSVIRPEQERAKLYQQQLESIEVERQRGKFFEKLMFFLPFFKE